MKQTKFPNGWDEKRVNAVLDHYEAQSEDEAVVEDETTLMKDSNKTFMDIPVDLAP